MAAFRRLFVFFCLLSTLASGVIAEQGVQPVHADAPVGDSRLPAGAAAAVPLGSLIKEDDTHFVADTGDDLDQYLFRTDRPEGKLKFNIQIKRYYFNTDDANIQFDGSGFLTPAAVTHATSKKTLPATVKLRMRVFDVDEEATWCPEVDLVYVNGKKLEENGQQARLSGANQTWSVVSYDVPISLLKFPQQVGRGGPPTPANNEIAIRIDASDCTYNGNPAWAVTVDYGILEIPSPVRPLVFAHGWTGSTESLKVINNRLKADGIPSAGHADLREGIYPIPDTASWLNDHIRKAAMEFGVDKVNLFAHSKGGLVSRRSLYDDGIPGMVEHLVTFDSPHHGTVWADNQPAMWAICHTVKYPFDWSKAELCYQATKEFSTESVRNTFNYTGCTYNIFTGWNNCVPKYVQQADVNYRAFAAIGEGIYNAVSPDESTQYPWDDNQEPMPSWPDGKWRNVDAAWKTDHGGILELLDAYQCSIHLLDSSRYSCPTAPTSAAAVQSATATTASMAAAQVILTQSGSLAGPGLFTATASVDDGAGQLVLEVYGNAALDFTLVEPGGRVINPAVASADPLIDYSDDLVFDMRHYVYLITSPIPGTWTARAQSYGAAAFTIVGAIDSPVTLSISTNKTAYQPGETITAQAALLQSGAALPGGTMTGEFEQSSGSFVPVSFYDNGANGDPIAGDGVFTARFTAPDVQANLYLKVVANRFATHREQSTLIPVSSQTGDIGSVTGEWTADDDGDGLIDRLMIRLNMQVLRTGHFDLQGVLVDSRGDFVQAAQFGSRSLGSAPLNPGTYAVVLEFNGQQIWESGKEGQFTLTGLVLSDSTGQIFQVDAVDNLYTTRTYTRSQFERPALGFESGSETATDQNGNNLYDVLTFRLWFNVLPTGSYVVNGRLVDKNGDEIAWGAANFSAPSSGVYPVELSFSGSDIGEHGVDGPYFLKDVSVYNQEGTTAAYFASLSTTQAYRFTQFENGFYRLYSPIVARNFATAPSDTYEPNNTRDQAYGPLNSGVVYTSYIASDSDVDYYYFDIATLGKVTVDLSNINAPDTDIDMSMYNEAGVRVGGSWGVIASEQIVFEPVTTGRYYVQVYFCCGTNSPTRPYYLSVQYNGARGNGDIYGTVRANGGGIPGAPISLNFYDSNTYAFRRVWTVTDAAGHYHFWGMETLGSNQRYYPYYGYVLGSNYIGYWYGANILSYTAGGVLFGGDMDISPLNLGAPNSTTGVSLPVAFNWTPRSTSPTETYRLYIYDPSGYNIYWWSHDLGHVGSYSLTGLPAGFTTDHTYRWRVYASGANGAYGYSYYTNNVAFSSSRATIIDSADIPLGWNEIDSVHSKEQKPLR